MLVFSCLLFLYFISNCFHERWVLVADLLLFMWNLLKPVVSCNIFSLISCRFIILGSMLPSRCLLIIFVAVLVFYWHIHHIILFTHLLYFYFHWLHRINLIVIINENVKHQFKSFFFFTCWRAQQLQKKVSLTIRNEAYDVIFKLSRFTCVNQIHNDTPLHNIM